MGNHLHMIIYVREPQGLTNFMCETKKKITDYIKTLFNLEQLTLWEPRSSVIEIPTYKDLVDRVVYFYLNPNRAGLVQRIDDYPGLTTWQNLSNVAETIDGRAEKFLPWISCSKLPILTEDQDFGWGQRVVNGLKASTDITEKLVIQPFQCLGVFGLSDDDIPNFKAEVIRRVREGEEKSLSEPTDSDSKKPTFKGIAALKKQRPTLTDYKPRIKTRRIFLICSDPQLRKQILAEYRAFFTRCRQCYQEYLKGDRSIVWPLGAFQPPMPCSHCARAM
jgi:hypothetical protein